MSEIGVIPVGIILVLLYLLCVACIIGVVGVGIGVFIGWVAVKIITACRDRGN